VHSKTFGDSFLPIRFHLCSILLIFAVLPPYLAARPLAAPKREVRAVWLTTLSGLDWPRSTEKAEQQSSLREIVRSLSVANFNTIFFQVRARGDAYYRSAYEPWAENLTGTLGNDPGWDPLAFLLNEAHAAGIEVHAWFNVYKVRGATVPAVSTPPHPSRAHPEWTVTAQGEGWLDPGIPEVRVYLTNVVLDLVRNYDLDGINFDFMRYPGRDFPDGETYKKHGRGMDRDDWRRDNINGFVTQCFDRATALRPVMKVGASPLGINGSESDPSSGAFRNYYQDARGWLKAGKLDYVAPQLYWNIGATPGDPDYAALLRSWQQSASGRHVYAGIGAYKSDVAKEVPAQIDSARMAGVSGQSYFRYESIKGRMLWGDRYDTPALIPPMPWKNGAAPDPPLQVGVTEVSSNVFRLEWIPATPAAANRTHHYIVYRWSSRRIPFDDPRAIAVITPHARPAYVDTIRTPTGPNYFYAVSPVDRLNNEGLASPVSGGTVREFLALKGKLTEVTGLSASLSTRGGAPRLIAYSLAGRTAVELSLIAQARDGTDTVITSLAHGIQDGGTYVVGMREAEIGPGKYLVRLKAGDAVLEQTIEWTR